MEKKCFDASNTFLKCVYAGSSQYIKSYSEFCTLVSRLKIYSEFGNLICFVHG